MPVFALLSIDSVMVLNRRRRDVMQIKPDAIVHRHVSRSCADRRVEAHPLCDLHTEESCAATCGSSVPDCSRTALPNRGRR